MLRFGTIDAEKFTKQSLGQCDQTIEKKSSPIFQKKIAEQKKAKISTSKPISKPKIPTTKQVLKLKNIYNKASFETAYLGENLKKVQFQKVAQNFAIFFGDFFQKKIRPAL